MMSERLELSVLQREDAWSDFRELSKSVLISARRHEKTNERLKSIEKAMQGWHYTP